MRLQYDEKKAKEIEKELKIPFKTKKLKENKITKLKKNKIEIQLEIDN